MTDTKDNDISRSAKDEDISRGLEHLPQSELEAVPGGAGLPPRDATTVMRKTDQSSYPDHERAEQEHRPPTDGDAE